MSERFSAIAEHYDAYALPQRRAAGELLAFTGPCHPAAILEPGCGTGLYTRLLHAAFPDASLLGIDRSAAMLRRAHLAAPRVAFRVADAETFQEGRYDLITSNATLQWFVDLPGSLARLAGLLAPGGLLTFSFFGPETYRELDQALCAALGDGVWVTSRRFAAADTVAAILAHIFPRHQIIERTYTQTYPSVRELLRAIKYTGTRGAPAGASIPWTPGRLARVDAAYRAITGDIRASFQVFFCRGES